jgi:hypothetical protein
MHRIRKLKIGVIFAALGLIAVACSPVVSSGPSPTQLPPDPDPVTETGELPDEQAEETAPESAVDPFQGIDLSFSTSPWPDTDFTRHSVDYSEIFSGGPPPDGIPAIDDPKFESVSDAAGWLGSDWPVMFFEWNGDARAYPLAILIHHEIVNDVVGEFPVSLTFCPLCNSTIAFSRTQPDGTVLDFGTTGNLRNSDLVMYDRQTKSWWQQFTGEAIVGELTGTQLELLPSQIIAFAEFEQNHPQGKVLSRETGHIRNYGQNPYAGYDTIDSNPWFPVTGDDDRLLPKERVVAIEVDGLDVAYPFTLLEDVKVVNDEVQEIPVVVFWKEGTTTTFGNFDLDTGSTGVFSRILDDQVLTFKADGVGFFTDLETGSSWNVLGQAFDGPMAGSQLDKVISGEHFWFAWSTFKPNTLVWSPSA